MNDPIITRRAATATLSGALMARAAAAESRPNVLLLHCHDLGQHLGCYGESTVQSPNLDRLAAEGVRFANHFCSAPQCSPSRASIFTGRYPHSNGVMGLTHADFAWDLHPGERHLGQILSDAGYATAGVGVIHETRSGARRCGLAEYDAATPAVDMATAAIARLREYSKSGSKPFYLQAGCIEPHRLASTNLSADQGFVGAQLKPDKTLGVKVPPYLRDTGGTRIELAELQGAVRHMDEQMGRILTAVSELGLAPNTLVIFTTDHGIAMPRAKCSLYEPGLRTSLIIRYPSRDGWHGGAVHKQLMTNIDELPTILDLLGVPTPAAVQGRSYAALLNGPGASYTPRDLIFGELTYHDYYDPRRSVRNQTHKLIVNFSSAPAFMDPSQSWRPRSDTITPPNHALAYHPAFELYDLSKDPWEQRDVSGDATQTGALSELRRQLISHLKLTKDPILDGAVSGPLHLRSQAWLEGG
jgi:N-sulfoglucosamine sulfohydrolase